MAEFPALPLWTDAYLADTSHLGAAEHGAYLLMLIHLWRAPMQRFPNNDAWLARKFGRSVEAFVSEYKPIMQEFMQTDGNWWTQKKLSKEWAYVQSLSQKRRDAAKARWEKKKDPCTWNAPTPTPTPTPSIPPSGGRAAARATRWAADRKVLLPWLHAADEARRSHGLPEIDLGLEAEKFANFWAAKSGAQATKLDWRRTWINWALKAERARNGGKGPTAHDKFLNAAASLIREQFADGAASEGDGNDPVGTVGRALLPP